MMPRMRVRFFGRDRKAVMAALKTLEAEQAQEREEIQAVLAAELAQQERLQQRIAHLSERIVEQSAVELKLRKLHEQAQTAAAVLTEAMAHYLRELDAEAERKREQLFSRLNAAKRLVRESLAAFEEVLSQAEKLAAAPTPEAEEAAVAGGPGSGGRVLPFRPAAREADPAAVPSGVTPVTATFITPRRDPAAVAPRWRPGTVGLKSVVEPAPEPQPLAPETLPAPAAAMPEKPARGTAPEDPVNVGLQRRLQRNVTRFLEGKVVGSDLHVPGGRLLAARGTPITPELAQQAEAEGVLSELILHMTWPEEMPE